MNEIALICFYNGVTIKQENSNKIAVEYGHKSGQKLFQYYSSYINQSNRIGQDTPMKIKNQIKRIEKIMKVLNNTSSKRAIDEMNILKKKI